MRFSVIPVLPPRRAKQMWRKYGLTAAGFYRLWKRQRGRCAICDKSFQGQAKQAQVEHSHKTQQVRGLACSWCNYRFLGPLERGGIARLRRAIPHLGWKL